MFVSTAPKIEIWCCLMNEHALVQSDQLWCGLMPFAFWNAMRKVVFCSLCVSGFMWSPHGELSGRGWEYLGCVGVEWVNECDELLVG